MQNAVTHWLRKSAFTLERNCRDQALASVEL